VRPADVRGIPPRLQIQPLQGQCNLVPSDREGIKIYGRIVSINVSKHILDTSSCFLDFFRPLLSDFFPVLDHEGFLLDFFQHLFMPNQISKVDKFTYFLCFLNAACFLNAVSSQP